MSDTWRTNSDYTDQQREIAAIFGFTPEQIYGCLGPSYIEAERQAKIQYEETEQRLISHAESLGMTVTDTARTTGSK